MIARISAQVRRCSGPQPHRGYMCAVVLTARCLTVDERRATGPWIWFQREEGRRMMLVIAEWGKFPSREADVTLWGDCISPYSGVHRGWSPRVITPSDGNTTQASQARCTHQDIIMFMPAATAAAAGNLCPFRSRSRMTHRVSSCCRLPRSRRQCTHLQAVAKPLQACSMCQ